MRLIDWFSTASAGNAVEVVKELSEAASGAGPRLPVNTGWSPSAYALWILVTIALGHVGKQLAPLYDRWSTRDEAATNRKRDDKLGQARRIGELEEKLARTTTAVGSLMNAIMVGIDGLESDDHGERTRAASQMRRHVGMAAATLGKDDPFLHALNTLAETSMGQAHPAPVPTPPPAPAAE